MHNDGSLAKYLAKNGSGASLSDPTGFGKYLPGYEATEPEKPHEANYKQVFSDQHSGGIGRYV